VEHKTPGRILYLGKNGEFISGVPACDMSLEQWLAVPEDLRALALALALYRIEQDKEQS
jgi:hypothetical protein